MRLIQKYQPDTVSTETAELQKNRLCYHDWH